MIKVDLKMSAGLERIIREGGDAIRPAIAAAINEAALEGQRLIVQDTPVRTARLRNSIDVDLATPENLRASIHTNVEYAPYVEFGTGIYSEAPDAPRQPITYEVAARTTTRSAHKRAKPGRKKKTVYVRESRAFDVAAHTRTHNGQKPAAMFRSNIPFIEQALVEAMQKHVPEAFRGES